MAVVRRLLVPLLVVAAVVAGSVGVFPLEVAQAAPGQAAVSRDAGTTTISGLVTRSNGKPAIYAEVYLYQNGRVRAGPAASVDRDGRYTIDDVAPGTYRVCANVDFQTACHSEVATVDEATAVKVAGHPRTGIDIAFLSPGVLRGTVTLAGQPLADATVEVYPRSSYLRGNRQYPDMVGGFLSTDDQGRFRVGQISRGTYIVEVNDYEHARAQVTYSGDVATIAKAVPFTVGSDETTVQNVAARPASAITGTMRNAVGTPVAGRVDLYSVGQDAQTTFLGSDETDDGTYEFAPTAAGRYVLRFVPDSPRLAIRWDGGAVSSDDAPVVVVRRGQRLTGVDVRLPRAADITGTLTDATSGDPVGFALVRLLKSDGAGGWTVVASYEGYLGFGGGPEGYYDFPHQAPGTYRISATELGYHDLYLPSGSTPDQGADFVARAGQQLTVDATMQRVAAIVGHLQVDAGSSSYPAAYTDIDVYKRASDGTWQHLPGPGRPESDRIGDYRVAGLAPGTYRVGFSYVTLVPEFFDDQPTLAAATDIVVTRDHWSVADAVLEPRS